MIQLFSAIRKNPEVAKHSSFCHQYAILKTKDEIEGVLIKGIDQHMISIT